jgi:hypothetical protein
MEESENQTEQEEKRDKGSNSCVMDLSIDGGNGTEEVENINKNEIHNGTSLNKSFDDKINFRKKLNLKDNFENILDSGQDERTLIDAQNIDILKTRSKTFKVKKSSNKMAPRPQPIIIDEYIKPLRLDSNKSIIREISQKDIIECKSCDDKSDKGKNCMNFFNYEDSEEEIENTLKINKINEINIETKKMLFDYKLNSKYYNEYENILNIEKIFFKNVYNNDIYDDVLIGKNKNMQNRDKRKFWRKHINNFKKELNYIEKSEKNINKNEFRKRRSDTFSKKSNHEGLFILGVLQSAAKEKKGRKTVHNNRIKHIQKDDFEDGK